MNKLMTMLVLMTGFTWLLILLASMVRARGWTPGGFLFALSNREHPPSGTAFSGRADRTAANQMENFVLFAVLALAAQATGTTAPQVLAGAEVFCWSRLLYAPLYYAGVPYLRTLAWGGGVAGMLMMALGLLGR